MRPAKYTEKKLFAATSGALGAKAIHKLHLVGEYATAAQPLSSLSRIPEAWQVSLPIDRRPATAWALVRESVLSLITPGVVLCTEKENLTHIL